MQKADFINFRQYYKQAAVLISADDYYQTFITHKVRHSAQVLKFGKKIIYQTVELTTKTLDFVAAAERALLFHDVGRFEEGTLRYQAEQNKEYIAAASSQLNHGDLGYNTLLKNPLYNDPRILAAVKFHGLMMEDVYNAPEWQNFMLLSNKEEINQILFLVRDADKLANLQSIQKEQSLYRDIFYKQLPYERRNAPLSVDVVEQFMARQTILFPTVKTFADRILMVISWIYDINYSASYRISQESGYIKYLLAELEKYNLDKTLQQKIVNQVNEAETKCE